MKKFRIGDLVLITLLNKKSSHDKWASVKGYDTNPTLRGYHHTIWVDEGIFGIVVRCSNQFFQVFVDKKLVWIETCYLDDMKCQKK